eukprot:815396-Alexandrium_andersonii.AAC.1
MVTAEEGAALRASGGGGKGGRSGKSGRGGPAGRPAPRSRASSQGTASGKHWVPKSLSAVPPPADLAAPPAEGGSGGPRAIADGPRTGEASASEAPASERPME